MSHCSLFAIAVVIPLDEIKAEWEKTNGLFHKQRVAEHYGIYHHMFDGATFVPRVVLRVEYSLDDEHVMPVYHGNFVTPTEVSYNRSLGRILSVPKLIRSHTDFNWPDSSVT